MKQQSTKGRTASCLKTFTAIIMLLVLPGVQADAQTYFSSFADPTGKFSTVRPNGGVCLFPVISNPSEVADASRTNYASVSALLSTGVLCTNDNYAVRASIAFPTGMTQAAAGTYAGFVIRLNQILSLAVLEANISMSTFLGGVEQQSVAGANLLGLDLLSGSLNPTAVRFQATLPFDAVEIRLKAGIVTLNTLFEHRYYYAFASASSILPVKLASFGAEAEGKNVRLNWTSATEYNVARYEIEKSSDNGELFAKVGTVNAKGSTSLESKYTYTDQSVGAGTFVYRLKMIDRDGTAEYSKIASVLAAGEKTWKIYPTLLSTGRDIVVENKSSASGKSEIQIVNFHGQVLQSVTTTSNKATLTTGKLASGLYVVNCYQNGELKSSEKIVIR